MFSTRYGTTSGFGSPVRITTAGRFLSPQLTGTTDQMDYSRETDCLERYFICRGIRKGYTNYNISIELNRQVDATVLSNVLRQMILDSPYLAANAFRVGSDDDEKRNGANFRVDYVREITFKDTVSFETLTKVDNEFFMDLDQRWCAIDVQLPMWRLVLFEGYGRWIVSFYCDHTLFDGGSGALFMKNLVRHLDRFSKSASLTKQEILFEYHADGPRLGKIPFGAFTNLSLYKSSMFERLLMITKTVLPNWTTALMNSVTANGRKYSQYPLFDTGKPPELEPATKIVSLTLPSSVAKSLLALCKENQMTFTPLLSALTLYAFQESFIKKISDKKFSATIGIDIDGRRYLPQFKDKYGLTMSMSTVRANPLPSAKNWFETDSEVRQISKSLTQDLTTKFPFKFVSLLSYVNYWRQMDEKLNLTKLVTVDLSNLGVQDFSSGDFEVTNAWFSQSTGISQHMVVSSITVGQNTNMCFGFTRLLVEMASEQALADFKECFLQAAKELLENAS